jgi:hypothetical protein
MPDSVGSGQARREASGPGVEPDDRSLIDASAELVDAAVTYIRQETGDLVREKIVEPTQRAGVTAGLAVAIGSIAAIGLGFVATGILLLLAGWLGWPVALFVVGGVLLLAAAGVGFARSKKVTR